MEHYIEYDEGEARIRRIFSKGESAILEWHRDREDRSIQVISGEGWSLQMDNELPKNLKMGTRHNIKKNTFHRLFSGKDDLLISIEER